MIVLRYAVLFAILLSVTAVYAVTANDNSADTQAVRACYDGFMKAFNSKNGEQALTFVSEKSLQYYGTMLKVALHGEAKALEPLALADKYLVLSIRHRAPSDQVSELTPKSLYVLAVSNAWIGIAATGNRTIDTITMVSAEKAEVTQLAAGAKTNETITFHKENGAWKVNLAYQNAFINTMLTKALKESALPEKDFFGQILYVATSKRVLPSIWEPLIAKPAGQ